jgi:hypothetical protein
MWNKIVKSFSLSFLLLLCGCATLPGMIYNAGLVIRGIHGIVTLGSEPKEEKEEEKEDHVNTPLNPP